MSKEKLNAYRAAFEKKNQSRGDQTWKLFYPFWKIADEATAVVRFLPDADSSNNLGFLVEKLEHELYINGNKERIPCLDMWAESCPICNLSRKYYDEEGDTSINGKKYYRKKSYVGQIIVIDSPIEHDQSQLVKLVEFGPQVFKQIQAAFKSGDLEETPWEYKGGYHFRFRKTKTGQGQNSYTTSSFAPKQTDLDDDLINELKLFNLIEFRGKKPELATVNALLLADQTGQSLQANNDVSVQPVQPVNSTVTSPVSSGEIAADSPSPVTASKATSVLEQLKARAKASQTT